MISESSIQEATRRIVEAFAPDRVIVFGSVARGQAGASSDLDLMVVVPQVGDRRAMATAMGGVLWGLRLACDVVVLSREEFEREREQVGSVARPAAMEGRVVYDRAA
ncbi:MAG: nucleotidyltransferase domain-containing protein [Phycisphaerales bacterium]|nr:nucleotidyltransferase domain-containing protein [Phycisphaerales bacterium]